MEKNADWWGNGEFPGNTGGAMVNFPATSIALNIAQSEMRRHE